MRQQWPTGITPYDASLILQHRVGLIALFPVRTAAADVHPQPVPASLKALPVVRQLALVPADGYVSLNADDRAGVLSGELRLSDVERVELAPELGTFLLASRSESAGLRVVFAGPCAVTGAGEVLRLYGADVNQAQVEMATLNDGRIEVSLGDAGTRSGMSPLTTTLHGNWPNPFNPETTLRFDLAQAGVVQLEVFDLLGRKVTTLLAESLPVGSHQVEWRGVDGKGRRVSSGVYLYRLQAGDYTRMRRMLLLK